MNTRLVSFGGLGVAIHFNDENIGAVIEYLFQDLQEKTSSPPCMNYYSYYDEGSGVYSLKRENEEIYSGKSKSEMASMLMDQCLFNLVKPNKDGLMLHCAVLARDGVGIILPGISGAGKSTLSIWLTKQGFSYLSDELAFIQTGTEKIHSFTRPFNIKTRALTVIRDKFQIDTHADHLLRNELATLVPHREVNPDYNYTVPDLNVILFPRYEESAGFQLNALPPAQTGYDLMRCLINARNLKGDGFPEVVRLARKTRAYSMVYGGFEQLGDDFFEIFN